MESFKQQFLPSDQELEEYEISDVEEEKATQGFFSALKNKLNILKEGSALSKEQLEKMTEEFKVKLIEKNVSEEVA